MNKSVKQAVYFDVMATDTTINVPSDYPTIQAALNSVNNTYIPPKVTLKIHADGLFAQEKYIYVDHPQGDRIQISGAEPTQYAITGFLATGGSFEIFLEDSGGIAVGDVVLISAVDGTGHFHALYSSYLVTGLGANSVKVVPQLRHSVDVAAINVTSGTLVKLQTVIICQNGGGLHVAHGQALGGLSNIAFIGDGSSGSGDYGHIGVEAGAGSRLYLRNWVVAMGFGDFGCAISGNGTFADLNHGVFCQNTKSGLQISEGAGVAVHDGVLILAQNGEHGLFTNGTAPGCILTKIIATGNYYCGIVNHGSSLIIIGCGIGYNHNGISASRTAYINAKGSASFANVSNDYHAEYNSVLDATETGGYIVPPVYDPPIGTVGNVGGVIIG